MTTQAVPRTGALVTRHAARKGVPTPRIILHAGDFGVWPGGDEYLGAVDCALASFYAALYAALLLFATWVIFRRKPLNT